MRSPKERMETDPVFRTMVQNFLQMYNMTAEGITPSEIREAAGFAWQIYYERNVHPTLMVHSHEIQDR